MNVNGTDINQQIGVDEKVDPKAVIVLTIIGVIVIAVIIVTVLPQI